MQRLEKQLLWSASDLVNYLGCDHATDRDLAVLRGELVRPTHVAPLVELWRRLGSEHEQRFLEKLRISGVTIAEPLLSPGFSRKTLAGLRIGMDATLTAMRSGAAVVYQGVMLLAGSAEGAPLFLGYADFLLRVETPSALGAYSYEVMDTKLARSAKVSALMQMCAYSEALTYMQGLRPLQMHVELGDGRRESRALETVWDVYQEGKAHFLASLGATAITTYGEPNASCDMCRWLPDCKARWRADDHLSLVAGLQKVTRQKLELTGVRTVKDLAELTDAYTHPDIAPATLHKVRQQAQLQQQQRASGNVHYRLLPHASGSGLSNLPKSSTGDIFFDIESDNFAHDGNGLVYLFGLLTKAGRLDKDVSAEQVSTSYRALWGHTADGEQENFQKLLDIFVQARSTNPGMHIYHYGNFEIASLKQLAGKHGVGGDTVAALIASGIFVDLYGIVKGALLLSQEGYSLKQLEPLYMDARTTDVQSAGGSMVAYEAWRRVGGEETLAQIEEYNRDDCLSTYLLRNWLEQRRAELALPS